MFRRYLPAERVSGQRRVIFNRQEINKNTIGYPNLCGLQRLGLYSEMTCDAEMDCPKTPTLAKNARMGHSQKLE
jgi:hypothetical protein